MLPKPCHYRKQAAARFSQLWGRFSPKRRGEDLEESDDEQTCANELERIAAERALHSIGVKLLNLQALRSGIILDDLHPVHQVGLLAALFLTTTAW